MFLFEKSKLETEPVYSESQRWLWSDNWSINNPFSISQILSVIVSKALKKNKYFVLIYVKVYRACFVFGFKDINKLFRPMLVWH